MTATASPFSDGYCREAPVMVSRGAQACEFDSCCLQHSEATLFATEATES